jgi:xanthosine utilization system XapX-like protein
VNGLKGRYVGLAAGLAVGFVWMALGTLRMLAVLVIAAIGYVVGGVLAGEIDVQRYIDLMRKK